jgi:Cys-tRNA(Pro)/Cys-tRNA(Cys) deacylase
MTANFQSAVTDLLEQKSIQFQVIQIPLSENKKPIRSLEELLSGQGLQSHSVVRSIVFKGENSGFSLLVVAGSGRADWATLRKHLNERKCRMAEYDEVPEVTGYVVGAVPPIALPEDLQCCRLRNGSDRQRGAGLCAGVALNRLAELIGR